MRPLGNESDDLRLGRSEAGPAVLRPAPPPRAAGRRRRPHATRGAAIRLGHGSRLTERHRRRRLAASTVTCSPANRHRYQSRRATARPLRAGGAPRPNSRSPPRSRPALERADRDEAQSLRQGQGQRIVPAALITTSGRRSPRGPPGRGNWAEPAGGRVGSAFLSGTSVDGFRFEPQRAVTRRPCIGSGGCPGRALGSPDGSAARRFTMSIQSAGVLALAAFARLMSSTETANAPGRGPSARRSQKSNRPSSRPTRRAGHDGPGQLDRRVQRTSGVHLDPSSTLQAAATDTQRVRRLRRRGSMASRWPARRLPCCWRWSSPGGLPLVTILLIVSQLQCLGLAAHHPGRRRPNAR